VTLTDAGPLIALIDAGEPDHDRCRTTLEQLELPLLTTWPAFTEAINLLGQAARWPGQNAILKR
jgi:predicted nucleic acid-binding protein